MAMITMEIIILAQTSRHTDSHHHATRANAGAGVHLIYDSSNIHSVHWNYYWRPELVASCMFA